MIESLSACLSLAQLLLPGAIGSPSGAGVERPRPSIELEISEVIETEGVLVEYGFYGRGLCMRQLTEPDGSGRFAITFESRECDSLNHRFGMPEAVKAAAFFPGFQVVTLDMNWSEMGAPTVWKPNLVRLPLASIHGRLSNPDGEPLANREVRFYYRVTELMRFFGYAEGAVPRVELGTTRSDPEGQFWTELPWLLGDPFFEPRREIIPGLLSFPNEAVEVEVGSWSTKLSIAELYHEPLILRLEDL